MRHLNQGLSENYSLLCFKNLQMAQIIGKKKIYWADGSRNDDAGPIHQSCGYCRCLTFKRCDRSHDLQNDVVGKTIGCNDGYDC
ncbi:hypothetical protein Plhal304r1_c088g0170351 [Plasmopara halstedii]